MGRGAGAWLAATTSTSVVALRIGYFSPHRPDPDTVPARELAAWLSARDAAELVRAAVETDGLTFIVANGISANRYRRATCATRCSYWATNRSTMPGRPDAAGSHQLCAHPSGPRSLTAVYRVRR
jgi:hypothetical protein